MQKMVRTVLLGLVVCVACPAMLMAQYPSEVVGFNGPPIDQDDVGGGEMFRTPQFSGSTVNYIVANSDGAYDFNDSFRASGMQTEGDAALEAFFTWVDPDDLDSWMRLTTYDHSIRPNPALDTRGKVRFKITNRSGFFVGQIGLCLGIRETDVPVDQLDDGGTTGDIEWVGVDPALTMIDSGSNGVIDSTVSGDDVIIDTNGILVISWGPDRVLDSTANASSDDVAVAGYYYRTDGGKVPNPILILPASSAAVGVAWDLPSGDVSVYANGNWSSTPTVYDGIIAGMSGNGILDPGDNFRGTLEHLAVTNAEITTGFEYKVDFAIDELRFEATVPDPTDPPVIQAPVFNTATEVLVDCIADATVATLYINDVQYGSPVAPGTGDVATFDVTGALSTGDVLTATQTANGLESTPSLPVVVYEEGTALADSFDSYDSQEALELIWQQTLPDHDRMVRLGSGSAASCDNYVISDYDPGTEVSKLYAPIGTVNGTDAEPLVVTYKYRHNINNTEARTRFELAPELSRTYGAVGFAFSNGGDLPAAARQQYNTMTCSPDPVLPGYTSDYFGYDYAMTGKVREPGVWHEMKIEVKTSVVNFYIDGDLVNPVDTNGLPVTTNGEPAYADGVRRVNPDTPYKYVILGTGYSNSLESMYDDIAVTLGDTPIPFGPAIGVDSPTVVAPLFPGETQIELADVDSNAVEVAVYVDRAEVASVAGPFLDNVATVTIPSPLTDGEEVAATQTLSDESCLSRPIYVSVPAPTVEAELVPGQMSVAVSDIEENLAGAVSLYVELSEGEYEFLGTLANPTSDPASVPVTSVEYPAGLVDGETIVATQTIGGQEGPYSAGVVVAVPVVTVVDSPLQVGDTTVTVDGVSLLAQEVIVYVDDEEVGSVSSPGMTTVDVTVPALFVNDVVTANQIIGSVEGPISEPVLVSFPICRCIYSKDLNNGGASEWNINQSADTLVTFAFDYSSVGVPPSPSGAGDSLGMRLAANIVSPASLEAITVSPKSVPTLTAADGYSLEFDMWINTNWPSGTATGSTEFISAGIGYDDTTVNQAVGGGLTAATNGDGAWFAISSDGDAAQDVRAYFDTEAQAPSTGQFAAGTDSTANNTNFSDFYIDLFGVPPVPQSQIDIFPSQGTRDMMQGSLGMAWHRVAVTAIGERARWTIDGHVIANLDSAFAPSGFSFDGNVSFGFMDVYSSVSNYPDLSFGLIDNVRIVVGHTPGTAGDWDNDGDVDLDDFEAFEDCMAGPGTDAAPLTGASCVSVCHDVFDFDADEDVDLRDYALFLEAMD